MPIRRTLTRPALLLLQSALLMTPLLATAREVAAPAEHVEADGPYVFRTATGLEASWVCKDHVIRRHAGRPRWSRPNAAIGTR